MARSRTTLYDVLGSRREDPGPSGGGRPSRGASRGSVLFSRSLWRGGRSSLVLALAILVPTVLAYYLGTLAGARHAADGLKLMRSGSVRPVDSWGAGRSSSTEKGSFWAVQVVTYTDTVTNRSRANRLMDALESRGYSHVRPVRARGGRMIGVAVGRSTDRQSLEGLIQDLRELKERGKRVFKNPYARLVE